MVELQGSLDIFPGDGIIGEVEVDEGSVAVGQRVAGADLQVLVDRIEGLFVLGLVEEDAWVFEIFVSLH